MSPITPCLWFDRQAEEAAKFYVSIFKNSKITQIMHYGKEGFEIHGMPEGTVMTVEFELNGQPYTAMNGGPLFKFNEAVSLQVLCETQDEIDYFWGKLTPGGDKAAQQCGWLKDKFGLSWQVSPIVLRKMLTDKDPKKAGRAMKAMMGMKKMDIPALEKAYAGN